MQPWARPRPQPEARAALVPGTHSPVLPPRGTRPEGSGRVAVPRTAAVQRWPVGAGPWRSGDSAGGGGSLSLRGLGAAGGGSSSSGSSSSRSGGGEAMVAAPARAHMPGARGGRGAATGARETGGGCRAGLGK